MCLGPYKLKPDKWYQADLDALLKQYPRLADAIDGVNLALSKDPEGKPIVHPDYAIRSISVGTWPGIPPVHVYYQFNPIRGEVWLLHVQVSCVDNDSGEGDCEQEATGSPKKRKARPG